MRNGRAPLRIGAAAEERLHGRRRLRLALLGTVASGALWLTQPGPALAGPSGCTTVGGTATCSGDQSAGIGAADFDQAAVGTLNLNALTTDIAPASGVAAISYHRGGGSITINSDLSLREIRATGITDAVSASTDGDVTINHAGNISSAGGAGIYVTTTGGFFGTTDIRITSSGTIDAYSDGIHARYQGPGGSNGNIVVAHTGDITSRTTYGVFAETGAATVSVTTLGNINATASGILAAAVFEVTVSSTGNITGGSGIAAYSVFGAIAVSQRGDMAVTLDGIYIDNSSASATVVNNGNISAGRNALFIAAGDSISITSRGDLTARDTGIAATGLGVGVNSVGNIAVSHGSGMYIVGQAAVGVTSRGNISATDYGIFAGMLNVFGYFTTVDSAGDIVSSAGEGIHAETVAGVTSVTSRGTISAFADGIRAYAPGNVTVNSTGTVSSGSGNAIYASGGGNLEVTASGGVVSGALAGIRLDGGATNTVSIDATARIMGGLDAVLASTGNDTVNNSGIVSGNVVLGGGSNAFNNLSGSVFNSGAMVDLGAGNLLSNGGMLAPLGVGAVGTTTLTGDFVQGASGRFMVDVDAAGHSADRLNVTGTAGLGGKVVVDPLARLTTTTTYTIASAGNVSGTFTGVDFLTSNSFARNARLSYVGNDVLLTLDPGLLSYSLPSNASVNVRNVAAGIDAPLITGAALPAGFNALFAMAGTPLMNALTQASGETATGSQQTTFNAMSQFMGTLTDPFLAGRGDPHASAGVTGYAGDAPAYAGGRKRSGAERDAYAAISRKAPPAQTFESRWSAWAAGFGGSQTTDGNAQIGSNNATSRIAGAVAGADYWLSPHTVAGFALAGGGTSFSVANGGTGRSDLFQAGAFVRHNAGAAYVTGALAYGWQDITTDRTVIIAGADHLQARFKANAYSGRLEGGYRFVAPWIGGVGITPYAAAQFTAFDLPAYTERAITGNDTFALSYASKIVTASRSELGLRTDKSFGMADGIATLRGRLAWAHDFNPDRSIGATFQALPGSSFVVNGAAQAADAVLVSASAEKAWLNGWSAAATFEGEFSNVTRSYAGKGVVRYAW
ncbi:autotransporter outer membrane beta-barrel domain-containing protein [Bradyrhizobium liaoningense]|uniref:autotransporter outer membrane beta-barrel domain-containing protein n=1 Tax=Bradyrhizobium liaoningense TaxID=43992 RepID=UPI001BAE36CD|nr:autotransporter domain-containing protein [Bradyrhizobium liaoningense]MBR1169627.1 autotransporter domain-containing protein [Bradyrhizobium liaoningense]